MGLPNEGYLFYADLAKEMQEYKKPYFVSVAGLSLENNLTMLQHLSTVEAIDAIELNLSCPNVPGKPQTGYDFERTKHVLDQVCQLDQHTLGIKLPPYFDLIHFHQMAEIINQYPIQFVTCVNSIGNGLVIDVAGDASIQMCIQEMSAALQYNAPIKIFILNNQYMGMVRQWQQLLHGNRLSNTYTEAMPDFVKLAEAYGGTGIRCHKPEELDAAILKMIETDGPVIFDCRVANLANCFPMIPSGKAHNEMLLPDEATDEAIGSAIDDAGKKLV